MNFSLTWLLVGMILGGVIVAAVLWPHIHPKEQEAPEVDASLVEQMQKQFDDETDELERIAGLDEPATPAKMALVVERDHLPAYLQYADTPDLHPLPANFYQLPTRLVDRAVCETDENTLQLLPYVLIWDARNRFLSYRRGTGGGEGRLHGLLSIGWGGHVDTAPQGSDLESRSLRRHLYEEAAREVLEETGVTVFLDSFATLGLISDPTTPVGRVHLGILMAVHLPGDREIVAEVGSIDSARWMTVAELSEAVDEMEVWSRVALEHVILRRGGA